MSKRSLKGESFKKAKLAKTKTRRDALAKRRREGERRAQARRNDLLPQMDVTSIAISDLSPPKNRTRKDSPEQIDRMVQSISSYGFSQPIAVKANQVLDGWIRVQAATVLGLKEVPAIDCSRLDDAQARALALALNRLGERGEWDLDALHIELEELIELEIDPGVLGFTLEDQDIILLDPIEDGAQSEGQAEDGAESAAQDDEQVSEPEPDLPENVVTCPGDIWELGDHKIICGNALERDAYEALLGEERCHAVLTDPPYNVKIKGNVSGLGKKTHEDFAMASGEMSGDEFQAFLDRVLKLACAVVVAGAVLFMFMDWRSMHRVYAAGERAKLKLINLVVWYKETGGMGGLYRSAHELIAVLCKGKKPRVNNVELGKNGRDRTNVWAAPGANRRGSSANALLSEHATPKPLELSEDALLDVTKRGELVLDVFLGSGTTLIAAEKVGRHCRGIELEPRFVDLAVRRWEQLTGHEAILAGTGSSFAEIGQVRRADADAIADADDTGSHGSIAA